MKQEQFELLKYSSDKFVDREDQIALVMDKARLLAERRQVDRRTVIFLGERGTGKTWLLTHLQTQFAELPDILAFMLNLGQYAGEKPLLAVTSILKQLSTEVGNRRDGLGATLPDMSRNLTEDVQKLLEEQGLVLLIDQVYESDWKLLAALEDYLLGPLAMEPRVLIVMAGRGRAYPWKTPPLRLKAEFVDLGPFSDVEVTQEQLKRQHEKAVARTQEIHSLSGGNPLANYLLAVHDDPATALDQVVEGMLNTVPAQQRRQVRDYLEALCVLHSFDEARIPPMLAAYYDDESYQAWTHAQARQVREELIKWAFARWDADQGGYVLDGLTRKLLERYLQTQPERWERLQRAATELYEGWAQDYPRTQDRWQREVQYHLHQLQIACGGQLVAAV